MPLSGVRAPLGGQTQAGSAQEADAARALCSSRPPTCPRFILHSRWTPFPSASPSSPGSGEGRETWLKSLLRPTAAGLPPAHPATPFLDAEGSANSAQQAPGCCNLFMLTAQEVSDTGEENASNKIQRSRREGMENALHPPWRSGDKEMVWVLHLCQTRPILCVEQPVPCSNPKGQFLWKGRKGEINAFPRVTTAVSVGAVPLFCYPIC